jgi:mono/diheme cytochrome c family protein
LTRILIAGAAIVAVAALALAVTWWRTDATRADPADPVKVAQGGTLYAAHCASCHGAKLEGQPDWQRRKPDGRLPAPPHDASGHTWHHPDAVLFEITRDGVDAHAPQGYVSDMPGFRDKLSDDEIRAVLAYIKSTWPAEIRARQAGLSRR